MLTARTQAAVAVDRILGRDVGLQIAEGSAGMRVHVPICGGNGQAWFKYFMSHLASIGYSGAIDWTFQWDGQNSCVSLHELSHADSAVHVITSIALDNNLMYVNDGWLYAWWSQRSGNSGNEHVGQTMLKGSYLIDMEYAGGKRGWRFVMPLLNTNAIRPYRHQLPATVEQWQAQTPAAEQVG